MTNRDGDRPETDSASVVYFARAGDYLKIGFSINAPQRVRYLANDPVTLRPADLSREDRPVLIGTIPGDRDKEADVHADLWEWRVIGEWFEATPVVLAHVDNLLGRAAA